MEATGRGRLPEEILLIILPRLALKTNARFKCVSKPWKSLIESPYFRRLFVSLHKNSSSSWSLMLTNAHLEAFGFHACELWNLPKSPGSYPTPDPNHLPTYYRGSSNGLILIEIGHDYDYKSLVGNPVLQNWVEIPSPPEPCSKSTGLVTRVDQDGVVSSFKVVRTCESSDSDTNEWRVCVYSSESGLWSRKRLFSSHTMHNPSACDAMSLNKMIYLLETSVVPTEPDVLIAYDFYSGDEEEACRVIPLPLADHEHLRRSLRTSGGDVHLRRCLTSSGGDVFFIELIDRRLMMWRLKKIDDDWVEAEDLLPQFYKNNDWHFTTLNHILSFRSIKHCFPLAMNPFDSEIVYLWSLQHGCFVSGNLMSQEFIVHQESKNWNWRSDNEGCCRVNTCESKGYMQSVFDADKILMLSQFVLPQWLDSVPTIRQI